MWLDKENNKENHELNIGTLSRGVSLCILTAAAPNAFGNPQGGNVAAGQAHIQYGSTTVITQTTNKAIVNWKDFSINANETTQFVQPSKQSVTLNRVTGSNASQIMGKLTANGQIFLVNPNGIVFGKTAKVDVAGLVASTADIHDSDFMSGNYHFQNAPNGSKVINEGTITVHDAGLAALVAPNVENRGIIQAQMGKVILASGQAFTIDLYGDNLITFDASSVVHGGSVDNIGRIEANGGTVMMSVAAADKLVENVVNTSGYISATSVAQHNGKIVLQGYDNSTIKIAGTVDVSGKEKGETGGVIQASADYIQLLNNSYLDASGYAAGGNIHIGSDVFHNPADNPNINTLGLPTALRTAQYVYATPDAIVNADSINDGKAGNVVVWGDIGTWFYGKISAAAKGLSGDGGRIETSGKYLDVAGIRVDAHSAHGQSGLWLLDPNDINIVDSGSPSGGSFTGTNPILFAATGATSSIVSADDINSNLGNANVILTTTGSGSDLGNVTFNNASTPIAWTNDYSFTVLAENNIVFNVNNAIKKIAGAGVTNLRADSDANFTGTVTMGVGTRIQSTGDVNVYYNPIAFTDAANPYNANISATVKNQYMLVYDQSTLAAAGHYLTNIASGVPATYWTKNYALAQNITLSAAQIPIGSSATAYSGKFTGINSTNVTNTPSNYTISGLTVAGALRYTGLFGNVAGANASLSNITLISPNITSAYASTNGALGSIAGIVQSGATLSGNFEVISNGLTTVEGLRNVGGLFGNLGAAAKVTSGSTFSTRVNSGTFTISNLAVSAINIGGLFGSVSIASASGGLFDAASLINHATVVADANATGIGGIFGAWSGTGLTVSADMANHGEVSFTAGTSSSVGGIGGSISGNNTFTGTFYNDAAITGGNTLGSLIGSVTAGSYAGAMTSSGNVIGTGNTVGGLIGSFSGVTAALTGSNDFAINSPVTVSGVSNVGGLIGSFGASATFSRNIVLETPVGMQVIGSNDSIGGLFGIVSGAITAADNFNPASLINHANIQVTGVTAHNSIGGIFGSITKTGLTIDAMMQNTGNISFTDTAPTVVGGISGAFANNTFTGNMSNSGAILGASSLGGIVGSITAGTFTGDMTNMNTGIVSGTSTLGGVVGSVVGATLSGALTNAADVTGTSTTIGGLIGNIGTSTLSGVNKNFTVTAGTITGTGNVGGLIGNIAATTVVTRSGLFETSTGVTVKGSAGSVGGLIGSVATSAATAFNPVPTTALINRANIEITAGTGAGVGGIFGTMANVNQAISFNMENYGNITLSGSALPTSVGGILGSSSGSSFSGSMKNFGNITGASSVGGLIGSITTGAFTGLMTNVGDVTGVAAAGTVGGLIGSTGTATLSGSQNFTTTAGTITGTTVVGGLIGSMSATTTFTRSGLIETSSGVNISGAGANIGGLFGTVVAGASTVFAPTPVDGLINRANINITGGAGAGVGGIFGSFANVSQTMNVNMTNNGVISFSGGTPISVGGIAGSIAGSTWANTMSMINNGAVSGTGTATAGVGGIVGTITGNGTFSSAMINTANVTGTGTTSNVGGLIGIVTGAAAATPTTITGSADFKTTAGTINGTVNVGGLIGQMGASTIFNRTGDVSTSAGVTVTSNATGTVNLGGLFGLVTGALTTTSPTTNFSPTTLVNNATVNATATGAVMNNIGGVFGNFAKTTLVVPTLITNNGEVSTTSIGNAVGGIFGNVSGSTFNNTLTNNGNITGGTNVGGIAGTVTVATFSGALNSNADVSGYGNVGGVVGRITTGVFNGTQTYGSGSSVQTISLLGGSGLGGIVGSLAGGTLSGTASIANQVTYVAGSGTSDIGGIVGVLSGSPTITAAVFENKSFSVDGDNVGGYIGRFNSTLTLSKAFENTVNITGGNAVGGIIGAVTAAGTLSGALSNTAAITGFNDTGGLIGSMTAGTLSGTTTLTNTGTISGTSNVGGLIGEMSLTSRLIKTGAMTNSGSVSGTSDNIAGLFGAVSGTGTFTAAATLTNNGDIAGTGTLSNVGGIIGHFSRSITSAFTMNNVGNVTGTSATNVGGIVGQLADGTFSGTLTARADITGLNYVGGIVGQLSSGRLSGNNTYGNGLNAYNLTLASNGSGLGGIVGRMSGASSLTGTNTRAIQTLITYNADATTSNVGGIIGLFEGTSTIASTVTLTHRAFSVGASNVGGYIGQVNLDTLATTLNKPFTTTVSVTGGNNTGGIIGLLTQGTVSGALSNTLNVTSVGTSMTSGTGGLIGKMDGGALSSALSYSTGTVTGVNNVGGFIGEISNNVSVANLPAAALSIPISVTVQGSGSNIGGLFGQFAAAGNYATNLTNNATVKGTGTTSMNIGGIVGLLSNSTLSGTLISNHNIVGSQYVGGIVGELNNGVLSGALQFNANTSNAITVQGDASAQGGGFIAGRMTGASNISSPTISVNALAGFSSGTSTTLKNIGGIVGVLEDTSVLTMPAVLSNWSLPSINPSASTNVGGLIGYMLNAVYPTGSNLFSLKNTTGTTNVGGIVGFMENSSFDSVFTNTNNVTASNNVGGVIGRVSNSTLNLNNIQVADSSVLTATENIGGVVGWMDSGSISGTFDANATHSLNVASGTNVGAVIGKLAGALNGTLTNVTNLTANSSSNVGGVIGLSTMDTFANLSSSANVTGDNYVGGLVGALSNSNLSGTLYYGANTVTANTQGAGFIVGRMTGASNISSNNVLVDTGATFNADAMNVGGIVGVLENTSQLTPSGSWALPEINVTNGVNVGGFIGKLLNANAFNSTLINTISVTGDTNVGGVIGNSENSTIASMLTSTGNVTGTNSVGGVIGSMNNTVMTNHFIGAGSVTGTTDVGGVVGSMTNSTLAQSHFEGTLVGQDNVGGIVGTLFSGNVNEVYNTTGTMTGVNNIGGIVGYNVAGTINNVLFGSVVDFTGTNAGGIIGLNQGTINSSLSIGSITGIGTTQGGIVGDNTLGTINNTFYSVNTYPGLSAVGTGDAGTSQSGDYDTLGLASTFTPFGWSFPAVWSELTDHYVTLSWCGVDCGVINPFPPVPPDPPVPPAPNPNMIASQYSVVDRMLNQTNMTQYQEDGLPHTYNTGAYIYNIDASGIPKNTKVLTFQSASKQTPLQVAVEAVSVLEANRLLPLVTHAPGPSTPLYDEPARTDVLHHETIAGIDFNPIKK